MQTGAEAMIPWYFQIGKGMLSDLWTRLGSVLPSLQGGRPAVETVTEPVDEARALVCITLILLPEADEVAIV